MIQKPWILCILLASLHNFVVGSEAHQQGLDVFARFHREDLFAKAPREGFCKECLQKNVLMYDWT